jgi:hypothetical protein
MSRFLRPRCIALLVCLGLLLPSKPARADGLQTTAVEVIVGIVAVTAVITTAVILAIRHHPSITGCVSHGPNGPAISQGGQTYLLTGATANLPPGEQVKVEGKKKDTDSTGSRQFFVEKLKKDYGPCAAAPAP